MSKSFILAFPAQEIKRAFQFVWESKQQDRKKGHDFCGQTYYVTAADIERRVRGACAEQSEGLAYGKYGTNYSGYRSGLRISVPNQIGGLTGAVRKWLLDETRAGRLVAHNFTRGHISGARFRPATSPLSPQENDHLLKILKEGPRGENKLVHAADPLSKGYSRKTLCSRSARTSSSKKRMPYRRPSRSNAVFESQGRPVTCPRCIKMLKESTNEKENTESKDQAETQQSSGQAGQAGQG